MKRLATTLFIGLLAAACVDDNPGYAPESGLPDVCRGVETVEQPDALDILMVVDNSGDVEGEQERLASALPEFLDTLAARGISVRVGVVTTDASAAPGLAPPGQIAEGCGGNVQAIASSDAGGNWTEIAACNVVQGEDGQPRQQALEVIERSVVERRGNLDAFFREDARLLVVVFSNEDDCSSGADVGGEGAIRTQCVRNAGRLTKVSSYVDAIRDGAPGSEGVALAVVSGPPSSRELAPDEPVRPVCQSTLGAAYPANRLFEAATLFGDDGVFENLCTDDLSFTLAEIAAEAVDVRYCVDQ